MRQENGKRKRCGLEDFSKNFQAIIKQKGLSQLEIAEKSGIHKQTFGSYCLHHKLL